MEVFVDKLLPSVLERYENTCTCTKCIEDIKAIALNQLKPIYVSTDKGSLYIRLNELKVQFNTDIIREITAAINIVSNNPRHDR